MHAPTFTPRRLLPVCPSRRHGLNCVALQNEEESGTAVAAKEAAIADQVNNGWALGEYNTCTFCTIRMLHRVLGEQVANLARPGRHPHV